ncbi:MAG: YciI family protein [Aeromicrobium sp.]
MTMRFLLLVHVDESVDAGGPPDALFRAVETFRADTTHGRWVDDGGLTPSSEALWVRTDGGQATVLDGPFTETKEVIGGFFVIESPSADDMRQWTRQFVELHAEHWPALAFTAQVRQIADPA